MIGILTLGAIAYLALRKKRSVSGIGATYKRKIYREMRQLQNYVDWNLPFDAQDPDAQKLIERVSNEWYNSKFPNRKPITPERYYNQLRRAYRAISGIGETSLPYYESKIVNDRGDIILIHRDYGSPEEMLRDAIIYIEDQYINNYSLSNEEIGYWGTILGIATGQKFIWTSDSAHFGIEKLIFGKSAPQERKQRISYLANKSKGGVYPESYAESLLQYGTATDDRLVLDGVLDAIRNITSVKQAKDIIMDLYMRDHTIEEEVVEENNEIPF